MAIAVSITILELYKLGGAPKLEGLKHVATPLVRNLDYFDCGGHFDFCCWGADPFSGV